MTNALQHIWLANKTSTTLVTQTSASLTSVIPCMDCKQYGLLSYQLLRNSKNTSQEVQETPSHQFNYLDYQSNPLLLALSSDDTKSINLTPSLYQWPEFLIIKKSSYNSVMS